MTARRAVTALAVTALLLLGVIAGMAVVGRSQVAAQAPPAGLHVTLIRTAGTDLLQRDGVAVGRVPECDTEADLVVCDGNRADGAPIRVQGPATVPAGEPTPITVTVDGRVLAAVLAEDVVDTAGSAP